MTDQVIEFSVGVGGAVIVRDVAVKVFLEIYLFVRRVSFRLI